MVLTHQYRPRRGGEYLSGFQSPVAGFRTMDLTWNQVQVGFALEGDDTQVGFRILGLRLPCKRKEPQETRIAEATFPAHLCMNDINAYLQHRGCIMGTQSYLPVVRASDMPTGVSGSGTSSVFRRRKGGHLQHSKARSTPPLSNTAIQPFLHRKPW